MNRKYSLNTERHRKNAENDTKRRETRRNKTKTKTDNCQVGVSRKKTVICTNDNRQNKSNKIR